MVNVLFVLFFFVNQAVPVLMAGGAGKPPQAPSAEQQAAAAYQDGLSLVRARQFPEAVTLAERCLSLDPKKAECHLVAASAYARMEQREKAAHHYREFLKLAPDHESAPKVSKILEDYANHKAPSAQGKKTDEARAAYEDGRKLLKAKQYDQALLQTDKCLALEPQMVDCHMLAGAAYASMKEADQAARHYREFLRLAPDHPSAPKVQKILEEYERANAQ